MTLLVSACSLRVARGNGEESGDGEASRGAGLAEAAPNSYARTLGLHRRAPRTIRLYARTIERFEDWLLERRGYGAARASADDLIAYAATLPFTYASQMCLINAFKLYWRLHLRRTTPCPAEAVRCPRKPKMTYRGLDSPEDARLLIKSARQIDVRAGVAVALLYYPALRVAEAASLPWRADEHEELNVMGKGAQPRRVPIHPALRELLDEHRATAEESPYVFAGRYPGSHVSTNTINVWVKVAGYAALGRNVTPHQLRYTSGATMLDETGDLRAVGEYMGHAKSSLEITAGYTRTKKAKMRELMGTL